MSGRTESGQQIYEMWHFERGAGHFSHAALHTNDRALLCATAFSFPFCAKERLGDHPKRLNRRRDPLSAFGYPVTAVCYHLQ